MRLLAGSTHPILTRQVAELLNLKIVATELDVFSNGEKRVWVKDQDLRGENVTIIQSFSAPVDETIMETLLLIDALERAGAKHINLSIPWMGYSLQDKVFRPGEPISAKVVADLISQSYVKRIQLLDLHNDSIPAFFSMPTDYLTAIDLFANYLKINFPATKTVIASPDFGGLKRARTLASKLDLDLVNIDKTRNLKTGEVIAQGVHGKVNQKTVIVFDDVIVSGSTVVESAKILKEEGAARVVFVATHGLLTGQAKTSLAASEVDQILITNSIEHADLPAKFKVIDVAPILARGLAKWV